MMLEEGELVDDGNHGDVDLGNKEVKEHKHRRSEDEKKHKQRHKHKHRHREHKRHKKEKKEDKEQKSIENGKGGEDLEEGQIADDQGGEGNHSEAESGEIFGKAKLPVSENGGIAVHDSVLKIASAYDSPEEDQVLFASADRGTLNGERRRGIGKGVEQSSKVKDKVVEKHRDSSRSERRERDKEEKARKLVVEDNDKEARESKKVKSTEEKKESRSSKGVSEGKKIRSTEEAKEVQIYQGVREGKKSRSKEETEEGQAEGMRESKKASSREFTNGEKDDKQVRESKNARSKGEKKGDELSKHDKHKSAEGEKRKVSGDHHRDDHEDGALKDNGNEGKVKSDEKKAREKNVDDHLRLVDRDSGKIKDKSRIDGAREERKQELRRDGNNKAEDVEREAKRLKLQTDTKEIDARTHHLPSKPGRTPPRSENQDLKQASKSTGSPRENERARRDRSKSRESIREKERDSLLSSERRGDDGRSHRRGRSSSRDRQVDDRNGSKYARSASRDRHKDAGDVKARNRSASRDRYSDRDPRRDRDAVLNRDVRSRSDGRDRSHRDIGRGRDSRDDRRRDDRDSRRDDDRRDRDRDGRRRSDDTRRSGKGGESKESQARQEEENEEEYAKRVASQLKAQEEELDPDKLIEEARKRRQAIMEKYKKQKEEKAEVKGSAPPGVSIPAQTAIDNKEGTGVPSNTNSLNGAAMGSFVEDSQIAKPVTAESASFSEKPGQATNGHVSEDDAEMRDGGVEDTKNQTNGVVDLVTESAHNATMSKASGDMFADDIFGESPAGGQKLSRLDGAAPDVSGLIDNWDDAEGYYTFRIGEILDGRYEIASSHGRGVFSTVVKAYDLKAGPQDPSEVAIKIIRNNETMYKAGQQELVIIKKLSGADPENRRHCVRLHSHFEYRQHLCLVFESLHMNLREILKKFGRNIGINLTAVRSYAAQLLISLKHLRNCGVLHCDIKPDNMLVNEAKNVLKLADFGSAMFSGDNEITPYLVSRFYRAPEIMLGLPYEHALDMWSVGCCLYEMYTGKILFPGRTNNDMLRLHMELKGQFPKKLLKKAAFIDQHFDSDYNFCALEEDPVTKKMVKRIITNVHPKDVGVLLSGPGSVDEDSKMVAAFKDLLEKMFVLDPAKRINVSQAMNHPFILGK